MLGRLTGGFTLLALNTSAPDLSAVDGIPLTTIQLDLSRDDPTGAVRERYLGEKAAALYLIRPDQHVVARWSDTDAAQISKALRNAVAQEV